jgi:DNA-binding NarL/FixJ family response regulator
MLRILSLGLLIAAWSVASQFAGARLLPSPQAVALAVMAEATSGALFANQAATLVRVAAGEAAVDPRLAAAQIDELRKPPHQGLGSRPVDSELTDREWAVLDLLDAGLEASAIAEQLVVSIDTVRSHIKSLHRKLGVHCREELVGAIRTLRAPASPQPLAL